MTTGDVRVNNVALSRSEIWNGHQALLHGLTNANIAQLPKQSRHSFSIPRADVEEATPVLSGSGISINRQAHLVISILVSRLFDLLPLSLSSVLWRCYLQREIDFC